MNFNSCSVPSNAAGLHFGILFLSNGACYLNSSIAFECCKLLGNKLMKLHLSVYLKLFYMSFHQVRMMLVKSSPLLCFLAIFAISCCSTFAKQLLLFLPNLPSPLLSFVLPMMKLSKSIHYMEYELMVKNL